MKADVQTLLHGVARFVSAWLLPSAATVGLFWLICIPHLAERRYLDTLTGASGRDPIAALGVAAFATIVMATIFAYYSRTIYRILEGYHLPKSIRRSFQISQMRRRERLRAYSTTPNTGQTQGLATEAVGLYPKSLDDIMPTRLGNALKALETYGVSVYGLDSQQMWFELIGTAAEPVRREVEEARAMVDIFVAAIAASVGLSISSFLVALATREPASLLLAVSAAVFVPLAYEGAVIQMKDWANSVRSMVNLGRHNVAVAMGLEVPWRLEDEKKMWEVAINKLYFLSDDYGDGQWLDVFRRGTPKVVIDGYPRRPGRDAAEAAEAALDL